MGRIETSKMLVLVSATLTAGLMACGGGGGGGGGLDWQGTYAVEGVWIVSSPISSERTVGDAVTEALITKIAEGAGVPSEFQGEAQEVLTPLIADEVGPLVDENMPPALQPDSSLMTGLAALMQDIRVTSEIQLGEGSLLTDVGGGETVSLFEFDKDGATHQVSPRELTPPGSPDVTVVAEWEGSEEDNDMLEIEPHLFEFQFGELVMWAALNVLGETGAVDVGPTLASSIDCGELVTAILQDAGLSFAVAGVDYAVENVELESACQAMLPDLEERALGLFSVGTKVEVGGPVKLIDDDGDGKVDRMESGQGYGGILTVGPSPAFAPQVAVDFTGVRVER